MRRYEAKTNCKSNSDYLLVPLNHSTATPLSGLFNIFFICALRINPLYDAGGEIKIIIKKKVKRIYLSLSALKRVENIPRKGDGRYNNNNMIWSSSFYTSCIDVLLLSL